MLACCSRAARLTSRRNRSTLTPAARSGASTLSTTRRSKRSSVARKTRDIPPAVSSRSMRYAPSSDRSSCSRRVGAGSMSCERWAPGGRGGKGARTAACGVSLPLHHGDDMRIPRRSFLAASALALLPGARAVAWPRRRPVPSPAQLQWQRDELALFLHFGVNTFTDREWGDGRESPTIFAPTALDARQWSRAARAAGFKAMILTAKHHDGFCLWPTRTTQHSVTQSPFRAGQGDVVREFVDACRAENLKTGVYLSPWDRNSPVYGDSPRYNDLYAEQLTELLT